MNLLDSNILVAAIIGTHTHHGASRLIVERATRHDTLIAGHSVSETFSTLTRSGSSFRMSGATAWQAIAGLIAETRVVMLTAEQTADAIRRFSALGSGPRIYDFLIGATGEAHGATRIVTWNVKDFVPLFPGLTVVTPDAYALSGG